MKNAQEYPEILSVKEAAKLARVGTAQIYALARTPGFPAKRFGKIIRIHRDSFLQWLAKN
jgi:excisionase family DNA binding protein